ncbi:hypothetical protein Trydic_g12128 [Trypoxylus dichotomus]
MKFAFETHLLIKALNVHNKPTYSNPTVSFTNWNIDIFPARSLHHRLTHTHLWYRKIDGRNGRLTGSSGGHRSGLHVVNRKTTNKPRIKLVASTEGRGYDNEDYCSARIC